MAKKVLITGSGGFIGRHLKQALLSQNYSIAEFNSSDGDIATAKLNFQNVDYVIHLAGKSFVPDSWKNPAEFMRVNVEGTRNVLEFCKATKIPMVFMSSYVYGIPVRLPIDESHPVTPPNPYAQSKFEAEKVCNSYSEQFGIPLTIIRPFNIFGIGQPNHFLIPKIVDHVLDPSSNNIELMDLAPRRDYIYMDDLIAAMICLMEKRSIGIFNIGSGYSLSVKEIAEKIMAAAGMKKEVISSEEIRPNEIPDVVADISRIKKEIGWAPKVSFEEGISRIIASKKR